MSLQQNAGQNYSLLIYNKSLDNLTRFEHVGTTVTDQNCIHDESNRLNSVNACYHSVRNVLSSTLLLKQLKLKV
jgi:hypothetical protein